MSADCDSVNIQAEAPEDVDAVVLSDTGEVISGAASLRTGQNNFQILTRTSDENGGGNYQLSYRLNILRRSEDEYYAEPWRNLYHYSVKEGWANDPNGLMKLGDTWHMFYQFYPAGTDWGTMHWAHASSTDLIHWTIESTYSGQPDEYENAAGLRVETECPDLVRLPIEGESGWEWVLSYGGGRYQVGDFIDKNGNIANGAFVYLPLCVPLRGIDTILPLCAELISCSTHKFSTSRSFKEALNKSLHPSWRQIFRPASSKNLEIHKVFLRFFASRCMEICSPIRAR